MSENYNAEIIEKAFKTVERRFKNIASHSNGIVSQEIAYGQLNGLIKAKEAVLKEMERLENDTDGRRTC